MTYWNPFVLNTTMFSQRFNFILYNIIVCTLISQISASLLNITKCCEQNEAFDAQSRTCFQKVAEANEYDYLMDLFYYSMVHTDNHEGNVLSPSSYSVTSLGKPKCDFNSEHLEVVINSEEPGNEQFIITYPTNELFETSRFNYHQNFCVDVAYSRNQYWGIAAMFCNIDLHLVCQRKTCARFCCSPGLVFDEQIGYCRPAMDLGIYDVIPRLYKEETNSELHYNHNETEFIYGVPDCLKDADIGYTSHLLQHDQIMYNNNGELKVGDHYFNHEETCILQTENFDAVSQKFNYVTHANVCTHRND